MQRLCRRPASFFGCRLKSCGGHFGGWEKRRRVTAKEHSTMTKSSASRAALNCIGKDVSTRWTSLTSLMIHSGRSRGSTAGAFPAIDEQVKVYELRSKRPRTQASAPAHDIHSYRPSRLSGRRRTAVSSHPSRLLTFASSAHGCTIGCYC